MPIEIDIAHVARLARLGLSDEELARFGEQCSHILEHAALVQALPTEGVEPTAHPLPMVNAFRDDLVTPDTMLQREIVLSMAPDADDVYFRVPPALDDEA
ncbi:MAG: Asp-tRNA(Asn)/Glu-tRNA(Gln) amidotransferase subunit GatC [Acidimicrobiia bacterium]|nr:Asp-tRNA(Asn)/Glu-tRNA(Gln) amidotransferase subunit GatC [Acidimicrobiia bacterium]